MWMPVGRPAPAVVRLLEGTAGTDSGTARRDWPAGLLDATGEVGEADPLVGTVGAPVCSSPPRPNCKYAPVASAQTPTSATAPLHRSGAGRPRRRAELTSDPFQTDFRPTSDAVLSTPPEGDDTSAGQQQTADGQQQTTGQTEGTVATGNRVGGATRTTEAGVDLGRYAGRRRPTRHVGGRRRRGGYRRSA